MMNGKLDCGDYVSMTFQATPSLQTINLVYLFGSKVGHTLTRIQGSFFGRGAARVPCSQGVGGNHPELILSPGEQIHHCGHFFIPLHSSRNYGETCQMNSTGPKCRT